MMNRDELIHVLRGLQVVLSAQELEDLRQRAEVSIEVNKLRKDDNNDE